MIKAIISDFDGTLIDTFEANLKAYQDAFKDAGLELSYEKYKKCFGFRFDRFMVEMGIVENSIITNIKEAKRNYYPRYFNLLKLNLPLIELIRTCHAQGIKTAIASTARRENLVNVLEYFDIDNIFDVIYAGFDVLHGKPSPEIYLKAIDILGVNSEETLIFEDSEVGIEAAKASGSHCMIVSSIQFA